jgi:hypothetical protein
VAEPTLALPLTKLERELGVYFGFGRGANFDERAWTAPQQADISECVESGLRQFYYPTAVPGEAPGYSWTFLRPYTSMAFARGAFRLLLPDDFGGMEGDLRTFGADSGSWAIKGTDESYVRQLYEETPDEAGRPKWYAVQTVKGTSQVAGTRKQLHIFPKADQDYTLEFQYYVNPNAISPAYPYPYGGAQHAETILACCRAAAEWKKYGERGAEHAMMVERLAASISLDRRDKAQFIGVNRDPSYNSGRPVRGGRHYRQGDPVTWDGAGALD